MKISERIKEAMREKGMSQAELTKRSGVPKSTLSEWLNDRYEPKQDSIYILSKSLGVSPAWLMGLDVKKQVKTDIMSVYKQLNLSRKKRVISFANQQLEEQNKIISIEDTQTVYLNSKLSAGTGILDLDPTDTKEIEYSGYVPKHDLAFVVDGFSMEPSFADGEVVFVEKTPDVYNGQFIAVQINDEAYIKKVYIENDCLRLVSLNQEYDDIFACVNDDIRVIGRIVL